MTTSPDTTWPTISVIIPRLNQGHLIEETVCDGHTYRFLEEELRAAAFADCPPPPDRAALDREIVRHRKSFLVRRALHAESIRNRPRRLFRLVITTVQELSLFWFRPWLDAVKKQLVAS
jgi:hypothetical protein